MSETWAFLACSNVEQIQLYEREKIQNTNKTLAGFYSRKCFCCCCCYHWHSIVFEWIKFNYTIIGNSLFFAFFLVTSFISRRSLRLFFSSSASCVMNGNVFFYFTCWVVFFPLLIWPLSPDLVVLVSFQEELSVLKIFIWQIFIKLHEIQKKNQSFWIIFIEIFQSYQKLSKI